MTIAVVAAMCAFSADRADEQRFGREPTPGNGACFYENPDFEGDHFCVRACDVIDTLPRGMNDRISSIRVDTGRYGRYDDRDRDRGAVESGRDRREVSRERATEIVRRAYESVLNTSPTRRRRATSIA